VNGAKAEDPGSTRNEIQKREKGAPVDSGEVSAYLRDESAHYVRGSL
jgi:hypothetical protein